MMIYVIISLLYFSAGSHWFGNDNNTWLFFAGRANKRFRHERVFDDVLGDISNRDIDVSVDESAE